MPKKILITGATGFIGKNLAEYLMGRYVVYAPSRKDLDLMNKGFVRSYLEEHRFDVVIHAANMNDVTYRLSSYDILDGNLRMFYNLEACRDMYGKMVYFGSGAEYDMNHYVPLMKEDYFGLNIPNDPYGFSKYIMHKEAERSENIYNLILFGVYGKYEQYQRRFISNNICKGLSGQAMTINQNARFDYLYVGDLCRIVEWFVENMPRFHCYNVCTSDPIELLTIAGEIKEIAGFKEDIVVYQEGMKKEYSGCNGLLLEELGGIAFEDRRKAIRSMVEFYRCEKKNE